MFSFAAALTIMGRQERLAERDKSIYQRYQEMKAPGKWTYAWILKELAKKFFLSETRIQDIICEQRRVVEAEKTN